MTETHASSDEAGELPFFMTQDESGEINYWTPPVVGVEEIDLATGDACALRTIDLARELRQLGHVNEATLIISSVLASITSQGELRPVEWGFLTRISLLASLGALN